MKRIVLLILMLSAGPVFATPTLDAVTAPATRQAGGATLTISHTTGSQSNRVMIMFCATNAGTAGITATATYNSVSMTQFATTGGSASIYIVGFKLVAPASGTHNAVATFSSPFDGFESCAVETWYNVDQTTTVRTASTTTGTGTSTSLTPTCSTGDTLLDFIALPSGSNTFIKGGSQTARFTITNGGGSDVTLGSSAATCVTTSWSWTGSNDFRYISVALIPSASAPKVFKSKVIH